MTLSDDDAKVSLFGEVKKAPCSGGHTPDLKEIKKILEAGMAIAIFCTGCGYTQGLSETGLDSLLNEAGLKPIDNPAEYLLRCSHCPICSETFEDMELIKSNQGERP